MARRIKLGIIGGSGLCEFPELEKTEEIKLNTKYGRPSDSIVLGERRGENVAFLPRHGRDHLIPPHKVPYKANLAALKKLGVERVVSTCIAGSLRENIKPGDFVILDQFVNFTWGRDDYFDIDKKIIHLPMAEPYCPELRELARGCGESCGIPVHGSGTVVVIQGPRFSTKAESKWFSKQGWDIINMTQYPECYFAREMGLCYVSIAMITDYETGVKNGLNMSTEGISRVLNVFNENIKKGKELIFEMVGTLPKEKRCQCSKSLLDEYYKDSLH